MRIGRRLIGRTAGTAALLGVAFVSGVSINDLRSVHFEFVTTVVGAIPSAGSRPHGGTWARATYAHLPRPMPMCWRRSKQAIMAR